MDEHAGDERLDEENKAKFKQLQTATDAKGNQFAQLNWDNDMWEKVFRWRKNPMLICANRFFNEHLYSGRWTSSA